jgi:hypothetical protein
MHCHWPNGLYNKPQHPPKPFQGFSSTCAVATKAHIMTNNNPLRPNRINQVMLHKLFWSKPRKQQGKALEEHSLNAKRCKP